MLKRRDGFEDLYGRSFSRLFSTAYFLTGDREEAVDLTQEAFARAYERWRSVCQLAEQEAWLQRVVTNLALSWRRRERVRRRFAAYQRAEPPSVYEPDGAVTEALKSLTPAQRAVIVLRYYADLPVQEVADALRKRPGTVRTLTSQGLSRLRPLLQLKGVHS